MLPEVLIIILLPSGAFTAFLWKIRKGSQHLVHVARTDAARAQARQEAALEAAAVARHTADVAMNQTGQALAVSASIDNVGATLSELAGYLYDKFEGAEVTAAPAPRRIGRHSRPELPAAPDPAEGLLQ